MFLKHGIDSKNLFCTEFHQDFFERIQACWSNGLSADFVTIDNFKQEKYIDKPNTFIQEVVAATQKISSNAHLEYHLMIFKQYILIDYWNEKSANILDGSWKGRDVLQVADNIIDGYNFLLEKFTDKMDKLDEKQTERQRILDRWEKVKNGQPVSVPVGLREIDVFSGGFFGGELTIVAGATGMGKTTITLLICENASYNLGLRGHFYTLEMPKKQLQNRKIAKKLGIDKEDIRRLNLDFATMNAVIQEYDWMDNVSQLKIYDDCRTLSAIRDRVIQDMPEYIVIDYLQLVTIGDKVERKVGNREQEVSAISRGLKAIAIEFNIPVIALSQLSRGIEARQNKRPYLSDLRESGSLEQDADMVVFYYRPAYYQEKENIAVSEYEKGNMEYIIAKGRETGTAKFEISADFKINKLYDYWFNHNNSDEFYINREIALQPTIAPLPPVQLPPPPNT